MGKFEDALECYDKALAIDPNDKDILYNKGLTLHSLNRHDEAFQYYDRALQIDPNYILVLYNKGKSR